jgi:two-component system, OmpR family, sensor kinase
VSLIRPASDLRRRLQRTFNAVLIVVGVLGLVGIASRLATQRVVNELNHTQLPLLVANGRYLQLLTDTETAQRGFRLTLDPAFLEPYEAAMEELPERERQLRALASSYPEVEQAVLMELERAEIWLEEFSIPVITRVRADPSTVVSDADARVGKAKFDAFRAANRLASEAIDKRRRELERRGEVATIASATGTGIVLVAGLALTLRLSRRTTRYVAEPLEEMLDTVHKLSDGDLSARSAETGPAETQELARALNQLAASREQFEGLQGEAIRRLEDLDKARADFVAAVSHELRTPLTSVTGYAEMLADGDAGELNEQQARMVDTIDRNARRLLSLVEDLLTTSRIEAGALTMTMSPVDVVQVMRDALTAVEPTAAGKDLRLNFEAPPDLPSITGDAPKLERVLLNLLSNAVKFTPEGGQVSLSARAMDTDGVRIEVADSGIGIPAEEQPKLFERFFRASTAKEAVIPGTGLGLSIVKAIVEAHGGKVDLRSEPGQGTTFAVELPTDRRVAARQTGDK